MEFTHNHCTGSFILQSVILCMVLAAFCYTLVKPDFTGKMVFTCLHVIGFQIFIVNVQIIQCVC